MKEREFVVFVGPSGCGKSTLLRMIAGLEEITSGDVLIDGVRVNDVPPDARGLAMVFQSYALYPHMSVADNMGFALRLAGVPKDERRTKVLAAAKILQLEPLLDRKPGQLSGGQRQRVAIGRAIVRNPKVFLFDEPLSNLDAALRVQMRVELAKLHRDLKATMIYVTHDQVEAMTMADRIVVLNAGLRRAGRLAARALQSTAQQLRRRLHRFADDELHRGQGDGDVGAGGDGATAGRRDADGSGGERKRIGRRHADARRASRTICKVGASGAFAGPVMVVERLGGLTYLYVQLTPSQLIIVHAAGDVAGQSLRRGQGRAGARLAHLFRSDGVALAHLDSVAPSA